MLLLLPVCSGAEEEEPSAKLPIDGLVGRLATGDFVELTPARAPGYLDGIVDVAPQSDSPDFRVFSGEAASAGIRWVWMEFEPDGSGGKDAWKLIQIQIALPLSDAARKSVYDALAEAIQTKLGKPDASEAGSDRRITAWELRDGGALTLLEGELMHPETRTESRGVLLTGAIMAGEEGG